MAGGGRRERGPLRLKLVLIKLDGRWVARQALLERFTGVSFEG
jgi:hypothetical protein